MARARNAADRRTLAPSLNPHLLHVNNQANRTPAQGLKWLRDTGHE
jgi:hypothetical protein